MSWRLQDSKTRHLLDPLSSYCIRDQCFDGLVHPKTGLPMQKGTRIQTNDATFATKFAQRCAGHDYDHAPIEGGKVVSDTAFYPKKFCQRVVQLWKTSDETTPRKILKKFEEAREAEETNYTCHGCNSTNPIPDCPN